jgi:hypothetical protein
VFGQIPSHPSRLALNSVFPTLPATPLHPGKQAGRQAESNVYQYHMIFKKVFFINGLTELESDSQTFKLV